MDHCATPELVSFEEAIQLIHTQIAPTQHTETLALAQALDRILANDLIAPINVPAANNSAMDGYALAWVDNQHQYQLVGEALAGHVFSGQLNPGEAIRITTGGIIPAGADRVVMQENVRRTQNTIEVTIPCKHDENIRFAGDDIREGETVLSKGTRLSPLHIGLLASLGINKIAVFAKIRVAVVSTGDELLQPGETFSSGKIYDSNRIMLMALLQRLSVDIIDLGCQPDDPNLLRETFLRAIEIADLVISSGGVSVGDADYTKDILLQLGEINFYKIAMKPGKPLAFGKFRNSHCWFFGLPGNPVSSAVTYHQLVLPGLRQLSGEIFSPNIKLIATANEPLKKQPGRKDFQRGILQSHNNQLTISTSGLQSSAVLSGMAKANAYIILERERGKVEKGEQVEVMLFNRFLQ